MSVNAETATARPSRVRAVAGACAEIIGWTVTVAVVGVMIASFVLMARGYRVVAVTSGSMRPTYEVGDAVLVKPGITEEVRAGDIVVFTTGDRTQMTMHRIVDVLTLHGGRVVYRTKGDANTEADEQLLPVEALQGKGYQAIPHAGRVAHMLSATTARVVLVAVLLLLIGREVVTIVGIRRRQQRRLKAIPLQRAEPPSAVPAPQPAADQSTQVSGRE